MDIDSEETKKRKLEEDEPKSILDLDKVLKEHLESTQNMVKLLNYLAIKVIGFEKLFNKDLFKPS